MYLHDKKTSKDANEIWLQVVRYTFSTLSDPYQILAVIGNSFDDADDICGAQIKVKQRQDKICLWTKSGYDELKQRRIGYISEA